MNAPFAIRAPASPTYSLLQEQNWSASHLGSPNGWPDTLKVALQLILNSQEPMYIAWGHDRLFFFNEAYRPLLGPRWRTSMGQSMALVWHDIWGQVQGPVERVFAGETFRYEDQLLTMARHGMPEETYWHYSFSPIREPDGRVTGLFCAAREQTSRIATERRHEADNTALTVEVEKGREDLARAEEQLRQSQKLEAIGQLTGGVAHDFNNLLTVIKGSVDLLQRPDLTDERRQRYTDAIGAAAERAAKLTGQLLAFARRQALKPEIFDAGTNLNEVANIVRSLTGSRIDLQIITPQDPLSVLADRNQLDTAIINLAVNARDAMNGAGKLTIAVGPVSGIPTIRTHGAVAGDFVALTVADNGPGIPHDLVDRIFEPFFTTKKTGEGTGLGLSQVYGFVKQSGGDIRIDTQVGQGTTFTLYLPRADKKKLPDSLHIEPAVSGSGLCVLIVEDNSEVGDFAAEALRELGYDSFHVANAQNALAILKTDRNRFHIVFSDVVMAGMDGIEMGTQIRQEYPDVPVILTSGYSHILARSSQHGFELLQKPYSVEQLSRVLRKAISWHSAQLN